MVLFYLKKVDFFHTPYMAYRDSSIVYDHKYLIKHIFHIFFHQYVFKFIIRVRVRDIDKVTYRVRVPE